MTWSEEAARRTFERLDHVQLLWIYALSTRPRAGTGKARNYHSVTGKVKSKAKDLGVDQPDDDEIRRAFKSLTNSRILGPEGRSDTFILGDKKEYVKTTRVGKNIINEIHGRESIRQELEAELGVDTGEEEWWPDEYDPEDAGVRMTTTTPRPDDDADSYDIDVTAEFDCARCGEEISHRYTVTYPDEAYAAKISVDCDGCGTTWRHWKGNVYDDPEID